jgi:hypothetical protein
MACQLFHPENCCAKYTLFKTPWTPRYSDNYHKASGVVTISPLPLDLLVFAALRSQCVPKTKGAQREEEIVAPSNASPLIF